MNIEQNIKNLIKKIITESLDLSSLEGESHVSLETSRDRRFGDFSSNVALVMARKIGKPPLEVAQSLQRMLQQRLSSSALAGKIDRIEIKGGGFLNFFLSRSCLYEILSEIKKKKYNFGRGQLGRGQKIHIEFASANPTGPLNVAHARQAAFGDSLANLLQFSGYKVIKEYYLNDEGLQIDLLGESVRAKYLELIGQSVQFPISGYRGKYIDVLADEIRKNYGATLARKRLSFFSRFACQRILKGIKKDLNNFGVHYDCWFSQAKLNRSGKIARVLKILRKRGFLYEKEGAWWLASSKFDDDKDRVVIKSDSKMTYLTPDIAYHQTKYKRNFVKILNVWGPDHHGYIARLKAAMKALGYDVQRLQVLIVQLVSLSSADKIIPMSTRLGQFVSLHDILQTVGKDAARFFFLMRKRDAHLHFDLELAKKQSLENPVYYVQYAHARICNILKFAKTANKCKINIRKKLDLSLLNKPEELTIIHTLRQFPSLVESCTLHLEPHRLTTYLQDLAKNLHHYYEKHKVVTEDLAITKARLVLVDAVRIVLHNGLGLLAISAPEKM
jgi:arginyl-tRNA synthetase